MILKTYTAKRKYREENTERNKKYEEKWKTLIEYELKRNKNDH